MMTYVVDSCAAVGPWGLRPDRLAGWLAELDAGLTTPELPNVRGFARSPFINLTRHTMAECLGERYRKPAEPAAIGVVLSSVLGDIATADRASAAVAAGVAPVPMLFYQSVPVAVLGHLGTEYPMTGPMVCMSGGPELFDSTLETAEMMFTEGMSRVLVCYVEAGQDAWRPAAAQALAGFWGEPVVPPWDCAIALLVSPGKAPEPAPIETGTLPRPLAGFVELAVGSTAQLTTNAPRG